MMHGHHCNEMFLTLLSDDSITIEWVLTAKLIQSGKNATWCASYIHTSLTHPSIDEDVLAHALQIAWVRANCRTTQPAALIDQTIMMIYNAVCNNAFSLDTTLLGINYGAAFYEEIAYINHSCAPNAFSLRVGGCMAIYAAMDIEQGSEITHHYCPIVSLLGKKSLRGTFLHFVCKCSRCESEDDRIDGVLSALSFADDFAKEKHGKVCMNI